LSEAGSTVPLSVSGECYSRSEYANTFANVHGGSPTEVSATVILGGRQYAVSRRLTQGEASETLVDDSVATFASIGISPIEAVYPVVAQHGLQTFVHSKPKERRDAICAALGLDELTSLKSALESAHLSFLRTPPRALTQAQAEVAANASTLAQLKETQELAGRWRQTPPLIHLAADTEALLGAARALTGEECADATTALTSLRTRRLPSSPPSALAHMSWQEYGAGLLLFRDDAGHLEIALVHREGYQHVHRHEGAGAGFYEHCLGYYIRFGGVRVQ
jgi:hypothetical protein